jgi:hypothetical protein
MSETLAESLADVLYHCKLTNAIVPKMANIVITTISSTNVNPDCGLFPLDLRVKNQDRDLLFFIIKKKL